MSQSKVSMNNLLIEGDNLKGLQYLLDNEYGGKVDLCYIDPPYNTGRTFKINLDGDTRTIGYSDSDSVAYIDKFDGLDDYLGFIEDRLCLIYELLSDKGSFYLHCDYKYSHYLKVLCDSIFGFDNFKSDISRIKCNPKNNVNGGYGSVKDCILFYTKTDDYIWNTPYIPYTLGEVKEKFPKKDNGGCYQTVSLTAPGEVKDGVTGQKQWNGVELPKGRHWSRPPSELTRLDNDGLIEWSKNGNPRRKIYSHEVKGKRLQDVWYDFKDKPRPSYPTQKNKDLLDMIIRTSSNPNSIVLDCFMGSGTTLQCSYLNNRYWIGIDNSSKAIGLFEKEYHSLDNTLYGNRKYVKIKL